MDQCLEALKECLQTANTHDNKIFSSIIKDSLVALGLSESELANQLSVSHPSVPRWINGRNWPMRKNLK